MKFHVTGNENGTFKCRLLNGGRAWAGVTVCISYCSDMLQSCETVAVFCHFDNVELRISSVCKLPEFPTPTEVGYFGYHQFIFPFSKFISFGLLFILLQSSIANYHCVFIFTSFKRDKCICIN